MSQALNSGMLAPHSEEPSEVMTRGLTSRARQAQSVARTRPGKEDEAPTATTSPGPAPDRRISRTEVGTVKGNAAFMSPEQARGEAVDRRSDIFSAGMVMYYCLSGQLLYRGETTVNRLLRAAVGPATSQFGQIDQLPGPAVKVLNRALAVDPDKRYQSAAEFARDLLANMASRTDVTALMDELFPAGLRRDLR